MLSLGRTSAVALGLSRGTEGLGRKVLAGDCTFTCATRMSVGLGSIAIRISKDRDAAASAGAT